nr:LysM domain-containing protein [Ramlibacter cellulosilyticus]
MSIPAQAQNYPITPAQRSTAEQVAKAGVPLSELAPDAPDSYTVVRGDTLWAISGKFLRSPWRWPELWGMNLDAIRNPHLIYPGQTLYLEKVDGMARLRTTPPGSDAPGTVRVSPRTRISGVNDTSIPVLPPHIIEPFLNEAIIVDTFEEVENAPRIVATTEDKVLLTLGDRAYARGRGAPLVEQDPRVVENYRIFRNAVPLREPVTGRILGYEAKYLGAAELVRSETVQTVPVAAGATSAIVPATIDIKRAKEEMRIGDRLLPMPPRQMESYVPHAPIVPVDAVIVSVYGDAVALVGQSSVVALSAGAAQGLDNGTVLAIQKTGPVIQDRSMQGDFARIKLPDERAGLLMVFRTFQNLSYALVLEVTQPVQVGDRVADPTTRR